jgi:hypothetical protein
LKQVLINYLYRYPLSAIKKYRRFGGYANYRRMLRGKSLMEKASFRLPPVASDPNGLAVYFLTGKHYLYQTLFCIHSLNKCGVNNLRFVLVDDGTFDSRLIKRIIKQLPGAEIITREIIEDNLQKYLPEHLYSVLHQKRKVYPHIKKLTDIHTIPGAEWKLVLDSDMLFWNRPTEMLDWLKNPHRPIHMVDCLESYGYTTALMEQLCGSTIPNLLNVGIIGLNSSNINWAHVNQWVKILEEKEGASYYLEQALTAMLVANTETNVLPPNAYIVNPDNVATDNLKGALHHYVDISKEWYFTQAWKKI